MGRQEEAPALVVLARALRPPALAGQQVASGAPLLQRLAGRADGCEHEDHDLMNEEGQKRWNTTEANY
jgi:hypothetical protein